MDNGEPYGVSEVFRSSGCTYRRRWNNGKRDGRGYTGINEVDELTIWVLIDAWPFPLSDKWAVVERALL
jgi:hypothetical protein